MAPLRAAINVKTGLMWPPDNGTVTRRRRKAMMKTEMGTSSFGSTSPESKHDMMEEVRLNTREAVATNSVRAALHI